MNTFWPLLIPALNGLLISFLLLRKTQLRYKIFLISAISLPVGFLATSLIIFWSYTFAGWKPNLVAVVASHGLVVLLSFCLVQKFQLGKIWNNTVELKDKFLKQIISFQKIPNNRKTEIAANFLCFLLFIVTATFFIQYYISYNTWNPLAGWDARYLWNPKAIFYVRIPEYWKNMFEPLNAFWMLPDYPHLLPGSVAWGWLLLGKEALVWPMIVSFVFPFCLCLFLLWYLMSEVAPWAGFVGASFFLAIPCYQFWSTTQYADIPLAFFTTSSVLFLVLAARTKQESLFLMSGLFAGASCWTKNEGLLFTVWLALIFSTFIFFHGAKQKEKKKMVICFIAGLLLPLLTTAFLKVYFGGGGIYLGSKKPIGEHFKLLVGFSKTKLISAYFLVYKINFEQWRGLWLLFFAAICLGGKQVFSHYKWIILATILLIDLGYFFIFHITPIELNFHIKTSLFRLLQHSAALALVFTIEIFGNGILNRK